MLNLSTTLTTPCGAEVTAITTFDAITLQRLCQRLCIKEDYTINNYSLKSAGEEDETSVDCRMYFFIKAVHSPTLAHDEEALASRQIGEEAKNNTVIVDA